MARKRHLLHTRIQSFLKTKKGALSQNIFAQKWRLTPRKLLYHLFLIALFLSAGIFSVVAQVPGVDRGNQGSSSVLLNQGKTFYEAGQFDQAVKLLQQAVTTYEASGDLLMQAMNLSNLSLAYQGLGNLTQAEQAIADSLSLLKLQQDGNKDRLKLLAQALGVKAQLRLATGKPEEALSLWQESARIYQVELDDKAGLIRSQIYQSLALQELGRYLEARKILIPLFRPLQNHPDLLIQAIGLRSLGNVIRVVGEEESLPQLLPLKDTEAANYLVQSQQLLEKSLQISQDLQSSQNISEAWLGLGNTARAAYNRAKDAFERVKIPKDQEEAQNQIIIALQHYQAAAEQTSSPLLGIQAQLNQLSLLIDFEQWQQQLEKESVKERELLQLPVQLNDFNLTELQNQIHQLSPSRSAVFANINLAQSLMKLSKIKSQELEVEQLLKTTLQEAQRIADPRSEAYALGYLGQLYEQAGGFFEAQDLTQKALTLTEKMAVTQAVNAKDIAYQGEWQLGRILRQQGKTKKALAAYEEAVDTLDSLRQDIISLQNPDFQFSFRDHVEPVYREFVDLLLTAEGDSRMGKMPIPQSQLKKARQAIEDLQVAELEDYLRCKLSSSNSLPIDQFIDKNNLKASVIYPIILQDRLEVIVKLPQQEELIHYTTPVSKSEVEKTLEQLLKDIRERKIGQDPKTQFQTVYKWLIQPAEPYFGNTVETLVFVLDSSLRNIPMAALYDGKQYLLEKKSVVLNMGLQLVDNKPLKKGEFKALIAGLSEARHSQKALNFVVRELEQIHLKVPKSKILLNQEFTTNTLRDSINSQPFPVVHLATHGQFSSSPDQTFISAHDNPIKVNQLGQFLRSREEKQPNALELLVLSACHTAVGDQRAALGIAGVSVRAGARTTIASLLNANDKSTSLLMELFYEQLGKPNVTRAEALREAQLSLLNQNGYQKPVYWAPYVLVGNWR